MNAARIATPTDLRPFVGSHDSALVHLVQLDRETERDVRHAIDEIYRDLPYIGGDPDLTACYLDGVSDPLSDLERHGVALLAVSTVGQIKVGDQSPIAGWRRTYFVVVPSGGYFQLVDQGKHVHSTDPSCDVAMRDLLVGIRSDIKLACWPSVDGVRQVHGSQVPWCPTCCFSEHIDLSSTNPSVPVTAPAIGSDVVMLALADAEVLLRTTGAVASVDRTHTALHGYLRACCKRLGIDVKETATATALIASLREDGRLLPDTPHHREQVVKVLRSLTAVVDSIGSLRNNASMAHPNEGLVRPPEAVLLINTARAIIQYVDSKMDSSVSDEDTSQP